MDDFPFNVALEELKCLTCVIQVLTCGQVDGGERRPFVAHSLLQVMVDVRLRDGRVIDHVLEVIRRLLNNAQVPRALRRHQVTDLPLMVRILLRSLRIASGLGRVAPEALLLLKAGQELLLEGSALVGWRQERQDSAWWYMHALTNWMPQSFFEVLELLWFYLTGAWFVDVADVTRVTPLLLKEQLFELLLCLLHLSTSLLLLEVALVELAAVLRRISIRLSGHHWLIYICNSLVLHLQDELIMFHRMLLQFIDINRSFWKLDLLQLFPPLLLLVLLHLVKAFL